MLFDRTRLVTGLLLLTITNVFCYEVNKQLPDTLQVGFATASYQIEGGWNADGKGENIWDRLAHTRPDLIVDRSTGDIADDSYHKFKEDVQLLNDIGAQVYRFSLSWSRILPTGESNIVNQPGVDYYNNLINELIANYIEPLVTIYHWDLPQPLQDIGGWPNPLLSDYYEDYTRVVFTLFGDRVKKWITFNEPLQVTMAGYGGVENAPALNRSGTVDYLAGHTLLLAHARGYHLYDQQFRPKQGGSIGISLDGGYYHPKTNSIADMKSAEEANQFDMGWFAHPIFSSEGDYPAVMRRNIDTNSQNEGRPRSRLPVFTPDQVQYIKGTADFFGLNHYSTYLTQPGDEYPIPSVNRDRGVIISFDPTWPGSASDWLKVVPWGFRNMLNWLKNEYNSPNIFVTENGFSDHGDLDDDDRVNYYNTYMQSMLDAIYEDGCNVTLYAAWSLMDNYEWMRGYSERFGVHHVNYTDPNRTRTPKKSAEFLKQVFKDRKLPNLKKSQYNGIKWK